MTLQLEINGKKFDPESVAYNLERAHWFATYALEQIDAKTDAYMDGKTKRIVMGAQELAMLAATIANSIEFIKTAQESAKEESQ